MVKLNITTLEDIKVACVKSVTFPSGVKEAFDKLKSRMETLKGRKMYGVFYSSKNEYYACLELDVDHPDNPGFEVITIPGGQYAKRKIQDWSKRVHEIAPAF